MTFTENLQYIMATQQVNKAQLSRDSGLSVGSISWLCAGKSARPRPTTIKKLSKALHCTESDLIGEDLPLHIRRWAPNADTCTLQLEKHLQSGPETDENMAVIARMQSRETQNKAADGVLPAAPLSLSLDDLQALFDACVDDNEPAVIFAQFGKQVYQLMTEVKKGE